MYAGFESIIEKINICKNNSENSSTTKVCKYIPVKISWRSFVNS